MMKNIMCIILLFSCFALNAQDKLTFSVGNTTCNNMDGSITATITAGVFPVTFAWSNGVTETVNALTHTIDNLPVDLYSVTFTDAHGCTAIAEDYVGKDMDLIKPIAKCKDFIITLDINGVDTLRPADIDDGSTDNCGISTMFVSKKYYDCSDIGLNQDVLLRVSDAEGNLTICESDVTVQGDCCEGFHFNQAIEHCCPPNSTNSGIQPLGTACDTPSGSGNSNLRKSTQNKGKTGVEYDEVDISELEFSFWPNPINNELNLNVKLPESATLDIKIFDMLNNLIYSQSSPVLKGIYQKQIALPNQLPEGTYIIQVSDRKSQLTKKILLVR